MKLKTSLITTIGISLFSTIVLGSLPTQQVKANTSNQQPTTDVSDNTDLNTQNTSQNNNEDSNSSSTDTISNTADSQKSINNSTSQQTQTTIQSATVTNAANTSTTTNSDDTQSATISFTDTGNSDGSVIDKTGSTYTLSGSYKVGTKITDLLPSDFTRAYTVNNPDTEIEAGTDKYNLSVTGKSLTMKVQGFNNPDNYEAPDLISPSYTVSNYGKKVNLIYTNGNPSLYSPSNTANGYTLTKLVDKNGNDLPTADGDSLIFTFDMPDISTTNPSGGYFIRAIYDTPFNQDLNVKYLDDEGNTLFTKTINKYKDGNDIMTGDVISDPSSIMDFDTDNYTYWKTNDLPYTVTGSNNVDIYLLLNNLNYTIVNYIDKSTGKIIYTDKLRGDVGNTISIKDIQSIQPSYHMVDNAGDYTVKKDNETLNLNVSDELVLNITQKVNGNIIFDAPVSNKLVKDILLSDSNNVTSFQYGMSKDILIPLDLSQVPGISLDQVINLLTAAGASNFVIDYGTNESISLTVSYQDSTGKEISSFTLSNSSNDDLDAVQSIKDNLPNNYTIVDENNLYTVKDGKIVVQVKTNSDNNTGSGSGSGSGDSDNNTGDKEAIEETLGTHPNLSSINIYDDNGNSTGSTVAPNTDWRTDEKMILNGKTYYRIATNQWVNANDIYVYYNNPSYVRTYSDSYKLLVNSQDQAITNRGLAAGSDWVSDRYAYFNDQKYYRVATNEWISASDAFEYQPIDQVVQTTSNAQLFDDKGNVVRTISSLSLKADKIATINGTKMYRVATNEWLPITDIQE